MIRRLMTTTTLCLIFIHLFISGLRDQLSDGMMLQHATSVVARDGGFSFIFSDLLISDPHDWWRLISLFSPT